MTKRLQARIWAVSTAFAVALACASGAKALQATANPLGGAVENHVDVLLKDKDGDGGCDVDRVVPMSVPAHGKRRDRVRWDVSNGCASDVTVKIVFKKYDPFETTCSKEKEVDKNETEKIKCRLAEGASDGHHDYAVYINGKLALDPDVEVWR